jgi:hypothetical protein
MAGEWLVFLLHTQEVPRSNLGLKTAVLTHVSRGSPQPFRASVVISSKVNPPSLPSTSCPIHDSLNNVLFDAIQPEMLQLYSQRYINTVRPRLTLFPYYVATVFIPRLHTASRWIVMTPLFRRWYCFHSKAPHSVVLTRYYAVVITLVLFSYQGSTQYRVDSLLSRCSDVTDD